MGFDLYNRSLKIRKSIETPTPKMGVHLGVWRFNFHTFPYFQPIRSMKCDSRASFWAHTFASPCLGREPKAKVATFFVIILHTMKEKFLFFCRQNMELKHLDTRRQRHE
jgi:hypothetical protein